MWWRHAIRLALRTPAPLLWASIWLFTWDLVIAVAPNVRVELALAVLAGGFAIRIVLRAALRPGMLRAVDAVARGEKPSMAEILQGRTKLVPMIVTEVVGTLVAAASLLCGALPGFLVLAAVGRGLPTVSVVATGLMFTGALAAYLYASLGLAVAEQVVVFEDKAALPALERAWELASGNRWRLFKVTLFGVLMESAANLLGVVSMVFGVFVTIPLARLAGDFARTALYKDLVHAFAVAQTRDMDDAPATPEPLLDAATDLQLRREALAIATERWRERTRIENARRARKARAAVFAPDPLS